MRILRAGLVAALCTILSWLPSIPLASAQQLEPPAASESSYDELIAGANAAFERGAHGEALALLDRAYEQRANPNILYNKARILEAKGDLKGALSLYETFVAAPGIDIEYRRETIERIKVLRETVAIVAEPAPAPRTTAPEAPAPAAVAAPAPVEPLEPAESSTNVLGIVLLSTGAAALTGGGITGLLARSSHNDQQDSTTLEERRDAADRVDTLSPIADLLFIGGGVLVGAGLATYLFGGSDDERALLAPYASPDGGGALARWRF